MSDLYELYQSIILDHNRRPRNFGEMDGATGHSHARNPLCGDEVDVWVKVADNRIDEISFRGVGCAISRAAASMMTTAVKGKTVEEAAELFDTFQAVVTGAVPAAAAETMDKSVAVFSGVAKFPVRVKCAVMPWHSLKAALAASNTRPDAGE
jgi:nitrogen fixation NifU-like protein